MKKFFKIGCLGFIGLIILMAVLGALMGDDTATEEPAAPAATETPEAETPTEEPAEEPAENVGVGQPLQVGDVTFLVNEVSTADNVGGEFGVNAQSQFTIVNISVTNNGNEAITVDSNFFKLLSGEKTYDPDGSAGIYANEDTDFFLSNVNPDVTIKGNVVFDVPADLANKQLQVQTGFFGTETGVINLQ